MFEGSKAWTFILLFSIIVGLGYTAHHLTSVDMANAMLQETKTKLAEMDEALYLRRKSWEETTEARSQTLVAMEKNQALKQTKDELDTRYRKIEGDVKHAVESMKTALEKMRAAAPGTERRDITLTNGQTLHGAKIRKVEAAGISLIHADGIGTFAPDMLPVDLIEQYDLGPDALLPQLEQLEASLSDSTPSITSRNHPDLESTSVKNGLSSLQRALDAATLRVSKEEKKVLELDREVRDAESKNLPTFNLRTMRDIAEGNAGQARNDLKKLKSELERLKTKGR